MYEVWLVVFVVFLFFLVKYYVGIVDGVFESLSFVVFLVVRFWGSYLFFLFFLSYLFVKWA